MTDRVPGGPRAPACTARSDSPSLQAGLAVEGHQGPLLGSLGLRTAPGLWRDRAFLAALAGGSVIALALGNVAAPDGGHFVNGSARFMAGWLAAQSLLEELFFRGVVYGWLGGRLWAMRKVLGVSPVNWIASALFVAAHLLSQPALWAVAVLAPSLVFGHFRERYGSLLPPMVLHLSYNAAFFLGPAGVLRLS